MLHSLEAYDARPMCSTHHRKSRKVLLSDQREVLARRIHHYATDSEVQPSYSLMHYQDGFAHESEVSLLPCLHACRTMQPDFQVADSNELQPVSADFDGEPWLQASAHLQSCGSVHFSGARPRR